MVEVYLMMFGDSKGGLDKGPDRMFMDRLKSGLKLTEVSSKDECDIIMVFVPIRSRAGTDIQAALHNLPDSHPAVLVMMHHTFDPYYLTPDSKIHINRNDVFAVDCVFHEDEGLLDSPRNDRAVDAVIKHLTEQFRSMSFQDLQIMDQLSITSLKEVTRLKMLISLITVSVVTYISFELNFMSEDTCINVELILVLLGLWAVLWVKYHEKHMKVLIADVAGTITFITLYKHNYILHIYGCEKVCVLIVLPLQICVDFILDVHGPRIGSA